MRDDIQRRRCGEIGKPDGFHLIQDSNRSQPTEIEPFRTFPKKVIRSAGDQQGAGCASLKMGKPFGNPVAPAESIPNPFNCNG
jgi:hypothetical protein